MRISKDVLCLLIVTGVTAVGCSGRAAGSDLPGVEAASTRSATSTAAPATEAPTAEPPTQTLAPTPTDAPQPAYNAGGNDYGYGSDDYGYGSGATPTTGAEPSVAGQATVGAATSPLGLILVDSRGHTLYALTKDAPGVSTCTGNCAQIWPALLVEGMPIAGDGVQAALLGVITRNDGGTQVTYDDKPLYAFSNDLAAGDMNGQGIGGVWFAVLADGEYAR